MTTKSGHHAPKEPGCGRTEVTTDIRPVGASIRQRLLIALLLLVLTGMAALYMTARTYGRESADASFDQLLHASALSMTDSLRLVHGQWQMDMPYAALELLAQAGEDRVFYRVSNADGRLITGYADLPEPPGTLPRNGDPMFFDASYSGESVRFVALLRHIAGPENAVGTIVEVGQTRRARNALAKDILWRATLAIGGFTAAILALVWLGVNLSLRPVARIERELLERESFELQPINTPVPAELRQLVQALDGFMGRLADNLDTLRLFIAEAAHQLRTPLAALRAQVQVALDEDDPAEQRRSLEAVLRNAERLSRLVNQLLSDASVNHRSTLQQFEPVDLRTLLRQAMHETVPQAAPCPDITLTESGAMATVTAVWVLGDGLMLREAFKNVIDNALKHGSTKGGAVRVKLDRCEGGWKVVIADDGPGVAAAHAHTIFERFVRGPGTRVMGAGLGLAIVRRVLVSHGGTIDLTNRVGGGLDVTVVLPEAP